MTSLLTVRRRAEEFAAQVHAIERGGAAAAPRPTEFGDLLDLVAALRGHRGPAPRGEFTRELRARLLVEAERPDGGDFPGPRLRPARGARERRLMAAASAVALLGGTTGVAAAAQGALPGEALYPVKRGIERADAALNVNSGARGRDLLEQAGSRLSEAERLLEGEPESTAQQIREVLADFEEQSAEGVGLLLTAFEQEEDRAAVVEVRAFAAEGSERLGSMAPVVPPEAEGELTSAALLLHGIDARAAALCPGCGEEQPVLQLPEVLSDVLPARVEVARVVPRGAGRRQDDSRRLESRGRAAKDPATRARRQHTGAADHAGTTPADPGPQPSATQPPGRRQAEPGTRPAGGGQPGVVPRAPTEVDVPGSDGGTPASGVPSVPDLPPVVEDLTEDLTDDVGTVLPDPVPAPAELLD